MHQITLETKKIAENLISDFERKNNNRFSKLFEYHQNPNLAYLVHFELKKALMFQIDDIVKLSQEKMKSDQNHCFNFIKPCPYCGLVWLKSQCTEATFCGNFPIEDDLIFEKYKYTQKYTFNITENGVNFTLNQDVSKPQAPTTNKQYNLTLNGRGCGKPIVWQNIPGLSAYQLKELIDPGLMDYFAKEVPKEELLNTLMRAQKSVKDQVDILKQQNKVIKI